MLRQEHQLTEEQLNNQDFLDRVQEDGLIVDLENKMLISQVLHPFLFSSTLTI